MNESTLKSTFLKVLKTQCPGIVALRHEDVRTSGIPDLSTTGFGRTCWWEFKYADPKFCSTGIQELTCLRLAAAGFCRYVIFEEKKDIQSTFIVHPRHIGDLIPEASCVGFDYRWLAKYIEQVHRG